MTRLPPAAPALTEKQWQQQLVDLATIRGWLLYHTHDSRRSAAGFPDLVLLRGPRLVVAELKTDSAPGPTEAQRRWLQAFAATGAETYLWRPRDLREAQAVLG